MSMRKTIAFLLVMVLVALAVAGYWYSRNSAAAAPDASVVASSAIQQPVVAPADNPPPVAPAATGPISPPAVYPPDSALIDVDPVTGRNSEVDLAWLAPCLSQGYDVEIAKDKDFIWIVFTTNHDRAGFYEPPDPDHPAMIFAPGGKLWNPYTSTGSIQLEAGHTYWYHIRTRSAFTGQEIRSPWSEPKSFTIKNG
jgi:hypothetical protein